MSICVQFSAIATKISRIYEISLSVIIQDETLLVEYAI